MLGVMTMNLTLIVSTVVMYGLDKMIGGIIMHGLAITMALTTFGLGVYEVLTLILFVSWDYVKDEVEKMLLNVEMKKYNKILENLGLARESQE